jgi:hypothetical protein
MCTEQKRNRFKQKIAKSEKLSLIFEENTRKLLETKLLSED